MALSPDIEDYVRDVVGSLTDDAAAAKIGVSINTYRALKTARYASEDTLLKFATAFEGVDLAHLHSLADKPVDNDAMIRQVQAAVGGLGLSVADRIEVMDMIRRKVRGVANSTQSNAA